MSWLVALLHNRLFLRDKCMITETSLMSQQLRRQELYYCFFAVLVWQSDVFASCICFCTYTYDIYVLIYHKNRSKWLSENKPSVLPFRTIQCLILMIPTMGSSEISFYGRMSNFLCVPQVLTQIHPLTFSWIQNNIKRWETVTAKKSSLLCDVARWSNRSLILKWLYDE